MVLSTTLRCESNVRGVAYQKLPEEWQINWATDRLCSNPS